MPTGARIRETRLAQGAMQAEIARRAGISASYLALIEKGRRPIGGALLGRLAEALNVDRARLSGDEDRALIDRITATATAYELPTDMQDQAPEFARRFPEWANLIARLTQDRDRDQDLIAVLADRLTHDPALADAMHELLTTVASIRSTAAILAQTPELERTWLDRFHTNLDAESRRLASGAEAIVSYFDEQTTAEAHQTPSEQAARFLEKLDQEMIADAEALAEALSKLPDRAARIARRALDQDAADAEALPDPDLSRSPLQTATHHQVPLSLVLRRIAALDSSCGLVICDASGALTRRRPVAGFGLPVIGAGCPLWPIYTAFSRPVSPVVARLETPDGALWLAHAAVEIVAQTEHGPVLEATMLLSRIPAAEAPHKIGPGCRVCPRENCPARREHSMLSGTQA